MKNEAREVLVLRSAAFDFLRMEIKRVCKGLWYKAFGNNLAVRVPRNSWKCRARRDREIFRDSGKLGAPEEPERFGKSISHGNSCDSVGLKSLREFRLWPRAPGRSIKFRDLREMKFLRWYGPLRLQGAAIPPLIARACRAVKFHVAGNLEKLLGYALTQIQFRHGPTVDQWKGRSCLDYRT